MFFNPDILLTRSVVSGKGNTPRFKRNHLNLYLTLPIHCSSLSVLTDIFSCPVMASTQHAGQHSRYPLNNYPSGDLRLPSLKDLNFYRPPPGESIPASSGAPNDFVPNIPDHAPRHVQWSRSAQPTGMQSANVLPPIPACPTAAAIPTTLPAPFSRP